MESKFQIPYWYIFETKRDLSGINLYTYFPSAQKAYRPTNINSQMTSQK